MDVLKKRLTKKQFSEYVNKKDFGSIPPTRLVIHHTADPTIEEWNGMQSILGMKSHYEKKGWPSGPHIYVAPDGIWLFTDMYDFGTHARAGNGEKDWLGRIKWYSVGIEVVGNYMAKRWEGGIKDRALHVIKTLQDKLEIDDDEIDFHNDWVNTACPGAQITKEWLFSELKSYGSQKKGEPSSWAKHAWDWFYEENFDRSVGPHTRVEAEWVATMLHNFKNKYLD